MSYYFDHLLLLLLSGTLIHSAVWPQYTWAENWGLCPLFGEEKMGPHLTQRAWAEAYLSTKWHLDLYPTIWPQQIWAANWGGDCAPLGEGVPM